MFVFCADEARCRAEVDNEVGSGRLGIQMTVGPTEDMMVGQGERGVTLTTSGVLVIL